MKAKLIAILVALLGTSPAFAEPVTLDVTPTFSAPAGVVAGYRLYRDCDTSPVLVGPVTSGQVISFVHDTANGNPKVVTRAFNSVGEGSGNCVELSLTLAPPGDVTTTYTCQLNPVSGGTCVAQ